MDVGMANATGFAAAAAVAGFAIYRWRERRRVRRVTAWVTNFLTRRGGGPPAELIVHCTDDRNWPVLASFTDGRTGARHRLQFACGGRSELHALLAETVDAPSR
jgi:hypothetical protein